MTIPLRSLALAVLSTLAIVPAACGDEEGGGEAVETSTTTSAPEAAEEVTLAANLSGKEEVPDAGVTDGSGVAEVKIAGDELCYKLNATMGEKPTLAHIHTGAAGVAGDVLVNLMPTFAEGESGFTAESCLKPDAAALASIQADPAGFYVNVHSAEHPKGAMRGQLAAGSGGGGTGGGTSGGSTTTTGSDGY